MPHRYRSNVSIHNTLFIFRGSSANIHQYTTNIQPATKNSNWPFLIGRPRGFLFGFQSDNKFRYKIPFLQLQNIVTDLKDRGVNNIQLEYIRNDKYSNITNAENDPELAIASIFQRKFLCLRAVPETSTGMCMW